MFNTNINVLQIFASTFFVFAILVIFPFFVMSKMNNKENKNKKIANILLKIVLPEIILFIIGVFAIFWIVKINLF
ncbi:hypothetical protein [Peptostreptococcus canis]|uniref:Uncharacterized protein n=1 Tax=Peptostreptococcus canis TaxID=1159213 RepID=A0ABR6TM07_9FIRM|nr:hypothetical protein [Peptostreptococcus canis]MBC2576449.1 hypothetical protein [Peptostreptococcus canis]MBP1998424.1 putative membrane protein YesL [Peptostreptococcus canis]